MKKFPFLNRESVLFVQHAADKIVAKARQIAQAVLVVMRINGYI